MPEPASTDAYPLPAFHFRVSLLGGSASDTAFQEVSGLSSTIDTEDYVEGGENRFVHKLPKTVSHPNLVLKRGLAPEDSPLVIWCREVIEGGFAEPIKPSRVLVVLLDEQAQPARSWLLDRAWPVKWEVDSLQSVKNEVAIETIELAYVAIETGHSSVARER